MIHKKCHKLIRVICDADSVRELPRHDRGGSNGSDIPPPDPSLVPSSTAISAAQAAAEAGITTQSDSDNISPIEEGSGKGTNEIQKKKFIIFNFQHFFNIKSGVKKEEILFLFLYTPP